MKTISFTVRANVPPPLEPLAALANNLWLSWNFDAVKLFMRLDSEVWEESRQNPVLALGRVSQQRLEQMAADTAFTDELGRVYDRFRDYLSRPRWYKGEAAPVIAYFSMEYGLDVSLPVYSGGLGMLSGDHLKTASDLGLPLVGVGLLYRQGYFKQYLSPDGFQQESYPENDWHNMPVRQVLDARGQPRSIEVEMGKTRVAAQIWEVRVGRVSAYLLDTNIEANAPQERMITATLYGGDRETRIRQEILLGVGGIRALEAMGIEVAVAHMNEGHSAFLALERIRLLMAGGGLSFKEARQALWPANVFTTHTPVPAGNECFSPELMAKYWSNFAAGLGLSWRDFMALGRLRRDDESEPFCMTVLALKLSAYTNGVSRLHGRVSRTMWAGLWPSLPLAEVPIRGLTNGVHPRTWISHDMLDLLDRTLGNGFEHDPADGDAWQRIGKVPAEELFRVHELRREKLVSFVRSQLRRQYARQGKTGAELESAGEALSPRTLTISFARRFATYKRANLLLRDRERLIRLLTDSERPIQLIFAGKAHPHDLEGKEIIRELVHFAAAPQLANRIVFMEDYDMTAARYLVSGSDVWLNTPRRPQEASGTSGMKAAVNGVLNLSVLDGWWAEGYQPEYGWAIGGGEEYGDPGLQDEVESKALYDLLEREIIPLFYERGPKDLPREWVRRMKAAMAGLGARFGSHRMLLEYAQEFYCPALEKQALFARDNFQRPRELAAYLEKLEAAWSQIQVVSVSVPGKSIYTVGEEIHARAQVKLGGLSPEQVSVRLYTGTLSSTGEIEGARDLEMEPVAVADGLHEYAARIKTERTGRQGYRLRVLPRHDDLVHAYLPGFIYWA
jgi:starch phosphorylase